MGKSTQMKAAAILISFTFLIIGFQNCAKISSSDSLSEASSQSLGGCSSGPFSSFCGNSHYFDSQGPTTVTKFPLRIRADGGLGVYTTSACGIFNSADSGATFQSMSLPGNLARDQVTGPNSFYVDGSNIYIGTPNGLYVSNNAGQSFTQTLSLSVAEGIYAQYPNSFPCISIGFGSSFVVSSVYASGLTVLVSTAIGTLTSHDGGQTFAPAVYYDQGFALPNAGSSITSFALSGGNIYAVNSSMYGNNPPPSYSPANGSCTARSGVTFRALYVSTDHGLTFNSLPASGDIGTSQVSVNGPNISFIGINESKDTGTHLMTSNNGGASFASNTQNLAGTGYDVLQSINGNILITNASSELMISKDQGKTFTAVPIDTSVGASGPHVFTFASNGNSLYVVTDNGVYQSNDGGISFPVHHSFNSQYCVSPWWIGAHGIAASGNSILLDNQSLWSSSDEGATFQLQPTPGSYINQLQAVGNVIMAATSTGLMSTNNWGASFSTPYAGNSTTISNQLIQVLPWSGAPGLLSLSIDGVDHLAPVKTYAATINMFVTSAVSSGSLVVAGLWHTPQGIGQQIVVFNNGQLTFSMPVKGNGQFSPVIYQNSGIYYVLADQLYASYDNGRSFVVVPGSPFTPQQIYSLNGNTYVTAGNTIGNSIYVIPAGSSNAVPWNGALK